MPQFILTLRVRIMGLGLLAGVAVGAVAWSTFATGSVDQRRLQADQLELARLKAPGRPPSILGALVADAMAHPLFALTTGPGAQPEPVIRVSGLSRTPVRRAALLSVNGAAATWLGVSQSLAGVTLLDVQASKVVVETPFGRKDVELDDQASSISPSSLSAAHAPDAIAPGLHLPLPPANAPALP